MPNQEKKEKDYIRIPREKLKFYKYLKTNKTIRALIKVINNLQRETK